ncbi:MULTISPECIES: restriction endonuclease subunit S [Pseudomonas syringae group]|uniref:restriction endonuclease subunit S n=1 Tax=Pseudomonas syringae group TaxID=136849 RepID=UPI000F006240|nr:MULTISPECIES: restriction endonuclease subunit S [Pseudomonas syringae group]MCF5747555.1 restriction endonuclease subunit S [Pseudomonas tremae]RMP29605.1 hypothetical protein ALQ25_03452 [Pseudomonas coronafaciens pv. atropurpurea]UQB36632.1 restriction endonuclease subunit S [Pseudomonas tremae]
MTALLTNNLPLLAGAPNGIKKLRELILELAVRGKLVPQDRTDEPASELLKRIAERKAQLVAEGKIKKQKALAQISDKEKPFNLPTNWEWVRLGQIGSVGSSSRVHQKDWQSSGVPFYRAREIVRLSRDAFVENELFISEELYQELSTKESVPRAGDIMLTGVGTIGVPYRVQEGDRFYFKDASVLIFKNYIAENSNYLLKYFFSPFWFNTIHAESMGTTVHTLTITRANETLCPLPPLAEQHRIVTKVHELMTLCDRLEAQQADAENAHGQLVQALLNSLTQAIDATEFAANWQRLVEHFHTLFSTESSIHALQQSLLQLALKGKLVPQDPNDEPASELYKSVEAEKQRLVAAKKIKDTPRLEPVSPEEEPFPIPSSWLWTRIGDICRPISSGSTPSSELFQYDEGIPFLKVYNIRNQEIDFDYKKQFISAEYHAEKMKRSVLIPGDVVMNIVGPPLGKVAIIPDTFPEWNCNQAIVFFGLVAPVSSEYIYTFLREGSFLKNIVLIGTAGQDNISVTKSKNIAVPLPPLAEQHRIVAKVDQLMVLCDQLRTRIIQARQLNAQLANTLVDRTLADDTKQAPVATDQKTARTLLAAEVTHRLHAQHTFGQRKLQKVVYLAEYAARLEAIQGSYLRNVAGPHDRQLMSQVESDLQKHQWYERIERETFGHAYRPLSKAGQHRMAYNRTWSANEQEKIERIIELMRDWDTDRCEMTVTLYAAWNDFIIDGHPVTDDAIVNEVMHRWNDAKLRFNKVEWLAVLSEMKKHCLLTPTGFGKRTSGGTLTLPGFE